MLLQNEMQNVVDYYNQMECNIKTAINFYIGKDHSTLSVLMMFLTVLIQNMPVVAVILMILILMMIDFFYNTPAQ